MPHCWKSHVVALIFLNISSGCNITIKLSQAFETHHSVICNANQSLVYTCTRRRANWSARCIGESTSNCPFLKNNGHPALKWFAKVSVKGFPIYKGLNKCSDWRYLDPFFLSFNVSESEYDQEIQQSHTADHPTAP